MPDIRITVDGRPAEITEWAARRHGREPAEMRMLFSRYGLEPAGYLNPRLALYDVEAVDRLVAGMPGRGKGGGRPRRAESALTSGREHPDEPMPAHLLGARHPDA